MIPKYGIHKCTCGRNCLQSTTDAQDAILLMIEKYGQQSSTLRSILRKMIKFKNSKKFRDLLDDLEMLEELEDDFLT